MDFDRLLWNVLTVGLPLIVLSLLCGYGYLSDTRRRRELVDSPWFWILAFCGVGSLGVWAIAGKYDDRQKRMEARYEARQRMAQEPMRSTGGATAQQFELQPGQSADNSGSLQYGYLPERRVPLHFLAGGLLALCAVSAVMLWRTGRRLSREKSA